MNVLPEGLIFQIAHDAELELRGRGKKRTLRCPFHDDRHASAFVDEANVFYCSVCTPNETLTAKSFCAKLGLNWSSYVRGGATTVRTSTWRAPSRSRPEPTFGASEARRVFEMALSRARSEKLSRNDRQLDEFLTRRGLGAAWDGGGFGVIEAGMDLPIEIRSWPDRGYRLVLPLLDAHGTIAGIQARAVTSIRPKTMFPEGSRISGSVFADPRGQAVLRGELRELPVLLGEGLTDTLALSICSPIPVIAVPGSSNAVASIGRWVRDRVLIIALDCDDVGERAALAAARAAHERSCLRTRRVRWPDGAKDACDVLVGRGASGLAEFLKKCIAEDHA